MCETEVWCTVRGRIAASGGEDRRGESWMPAAQQHAGCRCAEAVEGTRGSGTRRAASGSTYQSPLPLPLALPRESPLVLPLSRPEFWPAAAEAKLDGKFGPAIVCVCVLMGVGRGRGVSGAVVVDTRRLWARLRRRRGRCEKLDFTGGMRTRDDTTSSGVVERMSDALRRGRLRSQKDADGCRSGVVVG